ncbi:MAG: hypothetical protein AB7U92_20760 [Piscinibacter sp.]|uniref:hypothetical protein n=1 Tax=Piscinibacter sp. TaxID=1903157 RepID=UPI003D1444D7
MDDPGDTVPRPLFDSGPDTDWSDASAPRTMAVLSPTMIDALRHLTPAEGGAPDLLEVVACCLRLREPLLLSVVVDGWVWPLTLYPGAWMYRAPVDWRKAPPAGLWAARLLACEPPAVDAPVLARRGRARQFPPCHYPLGGLLWSLALLGPRQGLLGALAGQEFFRVFETEREPDATRPSGALGSVVTRLLAVPATLAEIARWPGMDPMRAARLLNGLYLQGRLVADDGPLNPDDEHPSAWSDTVPSRWPMQGTYVPTRPRRGAAR